MEHFQNAQVVRLLNCHDKYLTADNDTKDAVRQHRSGASWRAKWEVELVEGSLDVIRLRNCCFGGYLAASEKRFLLGATGCKVVLLPLPPNQQPQSLGESVEWKPVQHGLKYVKLQTKTGTFLRSNGLIKPYGNTVTHDKPQLAATQDWILWEVDVVQKAHETATTGSSHSAADSVVEPLRYHDGDLESGQVKKHRPAYTGFSAGEVLDDLASFGIARSRWTSPSLSGASASTFFSDEEEESSHGGQLVHYYFVDDEGRVDDKENGSFEFYGSTVQKLIHKVEKETGLDDFMLCRRNVINGRLYRFKLNLHRPPDRGTMSVFIVDPKAKVAKHIT